ncbi:UMTA methyltransferase family protein [Penicillium digitatum]|uniref:UMTA methyltransferase family protein n=1 Tax=Penicillium digitatum TaxID=36651 RepID=A0A7T6XU11_PENDI|nr:UMTA methyltransferase family protein [Penicillium digitatum]
MVSTPHEASSAPPEPSVTPTNAETPINALDPIAVDNFSDDTNSVFEDDMSDLTSLSSSVLEFEYENGRRYCSPRSGGYMMPNDEEEQDRMDLTHHIWLMLLGGELYNAPIKSSPQNILDLGTGTGIWAMDIAEKFPSAHVTGTDISPIQPTWVAPNIDFIVEDFESEWQYRLNHFDFIHARCLAGCVADWPGFIRRIYDHVKPGGYFESHESAVWARSDDGSLKQGSALMEWQKAINFAGDKSGRELNIYHKLKDWMLAAGFEDVSLTVYTLPFSPWPRDPHLKALGKYQAVQLQQAIDSYSLRLYTQVLGWGSDVAKIHNAMVKRELRDKRLHAYVQTVAVYGRKPLHF